MRWLCVLCCMCACVGCSHEAEITRLDCGQPIEAKIVGSDRDNVYIEKPFTGERAAIPRGQILDIDHPGSGMAVTGLVIGGVYTLQMAAGAAFLFAGSDDPYNQFLGQMYLISGAVGTMVGGGLLWWGYTIWSESVDAAAAAGRRERVEVTPLWLPDGEGGASLGVGVKLTW